MSKSELVALQRRTPGRYGKSVTYQGIVVNEETGKPESMPADVLESILSLADNDQETLWTIFARGFNEHAFSQVADPLQPYYGEGWTGEQCTAFRQLVNAGVRFSGQSQTDIAEGILRSMGLQPKVADVEVAE